MVTSAVLIVLESYMASNERPEWNVITIQVGSMLEVTTAGKQWLTFSPAGSASIAQQSVARMSFTSGPSQVPPVT